MYFMVVKIIVDVANITPTLVAEITATIKVPNAIPKIPPIAPEKPKRMAFERVNMTPGPGLRIVTAAIVTKIKYVSNVHLLGQNVLLNCHGLLRETGAVGS